MAATRPLVSILLAVHNGEEYLDEAIDSVRAQTLTDWELVIADNASTDATPELCRRAAAADARIRVLTVPEKGKNRAYNHAFDNSTGAYCCFFAADDVLPANSLERRVGVLRDAPDNAFSTCCLQTFSASPRYDGLLFPKDTRQPNYSGGSILFPRRLAEMIFPLPEEQPNEDTWSMLHLRAFGELRHLPEPLYLYRIHVNNSYGYDVPFETKRDGFLRRMAAYRLFERRYGKQDLPFVEEFVRPFIRGLDAAKERDVLRILRVTALGLSSKLLLVFYCSKTLYHIRHRWFRALSGGFQR
jgi:glycosyltransferase involved in cell wall biosynthesis